MPAPTAHLFGAHREGYDLALLMDPTYSPESQNISTITPFIGADGEMHDPGYRHFKLPAPQAIQEARKSSLVEYEEQLEAERQSWPISGTATSPLRPFTQTRKSTFPPALYPSTPSSSRPSTGSSMASTSSAGRRLGRLIRVSYRSDHSAPSITDDEDYSPDDPDLVPSPTYTFPPPTTTSRDDGPDARERSCWDEFEDDGETSTASGKGAGESLRQKVLAAQLGLQFTMIRTERRVKKMLGKSKKERRSTR
ncbi:uncharacterized protein SCHCODRAFT_01186686 [Schizophyllum commune H4-8]|nr:uncharacterized protein SCHCODRAFT_01186686 [Schizophyllum commune H4-8]KAI5900487.1 hypothetical protein SCHCODRAFT_01186686 [Schizophyllum commune H4-8]